MRDYITVVMDYKKETKIEEEYIFADYDKNHYRLVTQMHWNIYEDKPIKNSSQLFFNMRKIVNSDPSRFGIIESLLDKHNKLIVFYNFNFELAILKELSRFPYIKVAEYNGFRHDPIPDSNRWVYLVQYWSGGEGWNCVETNAIAFYSLSYSYRMMTQAAGRIDRLNTPFATLFYYKITSKSSIDVAIVKALKNKKSFNEREFEKKLLARKTKTIIEGE